MIGLIQAALTKAESNTKLIYESKQTYSEGSLKTFPPSKITVGSSPFLGSRTSLSYGLSTRL